MRKEISRKNRFKLSLVFVFILAASLAMWGCGSDSYDEPTDTQTNSVLINAATLKGWIDQGLVNNDKTWEKVVILDLTDVAGYTAGHIPGAQLMTLGEVAETRQEGPSPTVNMVLSGASMDDLIQAHGIDDRTTIVITGTSVPWVSRLYFVFRYWGFPKDRIKVIDGLWNAWNGAGYIETTVAPAIAKTDFSVRDIGQLCPDLRVSLAELINFVRDGVGIAVDARGDKSAAGSTTGVFTEDPALDYVVFEGTIKGGISDGTLAQGNYYDVNGYFNTASALRTLFETAGVDGSKTVYGYCKTGIWGSAVFFVLDAILDWPVMVYDGAWSQWGKMSDTFTAQGGELPPGSLWAVDDLTTYMDVINYNSPLTIEELDPEQLGDSNAVNEYWDPFLVDADGKLVANQIENEDAAYIVSSGAPTAGGGGAGGGC